MPKVNNKRLSFCVNNGFVSRTAIYEYKKTKPSVKHFTIYGLFFNQYFNVTYFSNNCVINFVVALRRPYSFDPPLAVGITLAGRCPLWIVYTWRNSWRIPRCAIGWHPSRKVRVQSSDWIALMTDSKPLLSHRADRWDNGCGVVVWRMRKEQWRDENMSTIDGTAQDPKHNTLLCQLKIAGGCYETHCT